MDSKEREAELKPCPFCNGHASLEEDGDFYVACNTERCVIGPSGIDLADAAGKWNTRSPAKPVITEEAVEAGAREFRRYLEDHYDRVQTEGVIRKGARFVLRAALPHMGGDHGR